MSCPRLKWLKGQIQGLTCCWQECLFYLHYLIFCCGLLSSESGAICWTSECRNLFCLWGKHLIPVPSRIYRSAKGRQYRLTLSKSGAHLKSLRDKYEVSCPASSQPSGTGSVQKQWLMVVVSLSEMGCDENIQSRWGLLHLHWPLRNDWGLLE